MCVCERESFNWHWAGCAKFAVLNAKFSALPHHAYAACLFNIFICCLPTGDAWKSIKTKLIYRHWLLFVLVEVAGGLERGAKGEGRRDCRQVVAEEGWAGWPQSSCENWNETLECQSSSHTHTHAHREGDWQTQQATGGGGVWAVVGNFGPKTLRNHLKSYLHFKLLRCSHNVELCCVSLWCAK